jgi:hypothetical protein
MAMEPERPFLLIALPGAAGPFNLDSACAFGNLRQDFEKLNHACAIADYAFKGYYVTLRNDNFRTARPNWRAPPPSLTI